MHYAIATIEETVTEESAARGDTASCDMSEFEPCGIRKAYDALRSGCWDHVDWRDTEVIAYPADSHQDMYTGVWESETLVIRADDPSNLDRLARIFNCGECAGSGYVLSLAPENVSRCPNCRGKGSCL